VSVRATGTCCYSCTKNINDAHLYLRLAIFLYNKRGARERQEVRPAIVVVCELAQSVRGVRAWVCYCGNGGGVSTMLCRI
jgi:hypothetical protein